MRANFVILLASAAVSACAVNPRATQREVISGSDILAEQSNMVAAYYMQGSRLDISFRNSAEAGKPAKWAFTVANTPTEDTRHRFVLLQNSNLLGRTTLVAAKRQNTDLLSSIGSEVTDNRVALIQNLGAVAKIAIGLVVSREQPDPNSPFTARFELTDPSQFTPAPTAAAGWHGWRHKDQSGLTIRVGPAPVTAMPYQPALLRSGMRGVFASACRPVIVEYQAPDSSKYEWRGKLADAETVEFTPLPRKGKIEYHEQCGTSVTNEKDPTKTTDEIIAAAVAQGNALKEAYDKASKE